MEDFMKYITPELLVLVPVLYMVGVALKNAKAFSDQLIPIMLGLIGVALSCVWVFSTTTMSNGQDIAMAVFGAITQGILVAGASVYANQVVKQAKKGDGMNDAQTAQLNDYQLRAVLYQMGVVPDDEATHEDLLRLLDSVAEKVQLYQGKYTK